MANAQDLEQQVAGLEQSNAALAQTEDGLGRTQEVQVNGETLVFPAGMSDEQISHAIETEYKPQDTPPTGSDARPHLMSSAISGMGDMASMGFGPEILATLQAAPASLASQFGDTPKSYPEEWSKIKDQYEGQNQQQQQNHPVAYAAGQIAGSVVPTTVGGKIIKSGAELLAERAPNLVKWLTNAGQANRLTRFGAATVPSAVTGAVSGGIYGFGSGSGDTGARLENAKSQAVVGAAGGAVGGAVGSHIAAKQAGNEAASQLQEIPMPDVTKGESINLPTGAKTGNVDMMRAEEAARQGVLGSEYQAKIGQADNLFKQEAESAVKSMGADNSEDALMGGINRARSRAAAEKRLATGLIQARNDALSKASVYKGYVNDTLINDMDQLSQTPDFKVALARESNKPIVQDFNVLKSLTADTKKPVPMAELAAWRSGLNSYRPGTQEGALSSQMGKQYDKWLDGMAQTALINADDDMLQKIATANKAYSKYKGATGTNRYRQQSPVLEKILNDSELTPRQVVNMAFGKGMGNDTTGQVVGRMLNIVPEGAKREAMQADFRRGLVQRALENSYDSTGEAISPAKLRNNLLKLQISEVYKTHLSNPEHDKALDGLIRDLGKYVNATSRRDVYSPSGGAVVRGVDWLIRGLGNLTGPAGGRIATEFLRVGTKEAMMAPDRRLVDKSLAKLASQIGAEMDSTPNYFGALAGGETAAALTQKNQPAQ